MTVSRLRAELAKAERAPLYPGRGKIRLVQAYAGGKTAVVFDLNAIDLGILAPVWKLPLFAATCSSCSGTAGSPRQGQ